ncbi:uncharacterized protein [Eurosta solidaginis]|uniref:uncharacterized protein n=1 Tax=Eurosta solidaginis TaxID=178769 RepID=UPI003530AF0F
MMDQHNDRKFTIPEYMDDIVEETPTTIPTMPTVSDDPTDESLETDMETGEAQIANEAVAEVSVTMKWGHYTQRYDAIHCAIMCDGFGVSDRVASCLATALFEDINFRDVRGELVIMDKSKAAREKIKARDEVLRKRYIDSNITAFSFDGRKNDSLTREKINDKFHTNMVKEPHLVVLKEPNAELLGYDNLGEEENAKHKLKKLNEFFNSKKLSIDQLIGIYSDGEPTT